MPRPELDVLSSPRGLVIAPAGCGKTQLIADALAEHQGKKKILVLTHTVAGVGALRSRLDKANVPRAKYSLTTLDGWAIRLISTFPARSGYDPALVNDATPDYNRIRDLAGSLLQTRHIFDPLSASYSHIFVDECQDCSIRQLNIIIHAANAIPTILMGDNLQGIFGFGGDALADWNNHICQNFPLLGQLNTPWRWNNAGSPELGRWLLSIRPSLETAAGIDLNSAPSAVNWVRLDGNNDHAKRLNAARIANGTGSILIIGNSMRPQSRFEFASQTPGAVTVEAVDLRDLVSFTHNFVISDPDALSRIIQFSGTMMTNVGGPNLLARIDSLRRGTARNPATTIEIAAISFQDTPTYLNAHNLLLEISRGHSVRIYRPEVFHCFIRALQACRDGRITLHEAAIQTREHNRLMGRSLPRMGVGSTLLLKGLEADTVVILHPEEMDAKNLYVALTRGAKKIIICSATPILGQF